MLGERPMASTPAVIAHPHVRMDRSVLAGSPYVAGTRIPVRRLWARARAGGAPPPGAPPRGDRPPARTHGPLGAGGQPVRGGHAHSGAPPLGVAPRWGVG